MNYDIYFVVECQNRNGLKTHIGTVGKKTLCGIQSRYPNHHYKKVMKIDDIREYLYGDVDLCKRCKQTLPSY